MHLVCKSLFFNHWSPLRESGAPRRTRQTVTWLHDILKPHVKYSIDYNFGG